MKKGNRTKRISQCHGASCGGAMLHACAFGTVIGIVAMLILILCLTSICMCLDYPHRLVTPFCIFAVLSSAFLSGSVAQKRLGRKALLSGAISGIMLCLLLLLFTYIARLSGFSASGGSGIVKILTVPIACLGSVICAAGPKKGKKRQKRR